MSTIHETNVLELMIDPLSRCLDIDSARRLVELTVDPAVQARVSHLAELANEGALSERERNEYDAYINAGEFISILKLKVMRQFGLELPG